ncbi:carbohydrate-binding module family 13 protein [Rhizophagus clarus]|uniref:Carbohydrate-binding module family 13 protein n=1 Tax=Rhizophagus clarus TaxID=94130 RepID=A0A8H3QJW7_9GLOM|nr:carbohydrate-binding module family 13 protein [Rhizophagus clarus]
MADNKLLLQLSQNLLEILDDEEYYDVTIEVEKNDGTLSHIKLPHILPEIFPAILRYIYGGNISLVEYDTLDIIKILIAANELSLQGLISYLQSFLIENKIDWMKQNFNLVYQISCENDSLLELQKFCTDYSNDDFNTLKNTLQQFIPLIEFTEFTSKEFLNKVYPYKKIIPEELHENLIKCFLDNNYKPGKKSKQTLNETKVIDSKNIDSKIITIQHAELLSKWIDRLENTDELKNSYEFKLILRGSRDGFTPEKFHKICDNKSHTISIIKVKDSEEILGNPNIWESRKHIPFSKCEYSETNDSFIFSFNNKKDIKSHILSRVNDKEHAIDNDLNHGPSFGYKDLKIYRDFDRPFNSFSSFCNKTSYEKHIRGNNGNDYSIQEYEVFQIIFID